MSDAGMAAGSSAPELFTSFADTFGPGSSIGIGTIVGSAMFNILVIVALSAAVATTEPLIDWRPITRDVGFYSCVPPSLPPFIFHRTSRSCTHCLFAFFARQQQSGFRL